MPGPLVAYLPTPRTTDGKVAEGVLAVLADRAVEAGVDGIAVLGSTGGYAYLDADQRDRVVRAGVEAADGRVPVIAGIGALTTQDVLDRAHAAQVAGAHGLLLPTMSYLPLLPDEVTGLFRDVTARCERPVWIYHNPRTTRVTLSLDDLVALAGIPGVGGLKDFGTSAQDVRGRCEHLVGAVGAHVEVGFSGDGLGVFGLLAGARTWHSGLAGILPGPWVEAAAAAVAGDFDAVEAVGRRIAPLVDLGATWGAMRLAVAVARTQGMDLGSLPAPLLAPPADVQARVEAAVAAATAAA